MTKKSFEKINGFPNNFWGGAEDDALRVRISKNNIVVYRPSEGNTYAPHDPPTKTEINEHKRKNRNYDSINWETDGLTPPNYQM
jgi:hypothetical protein